MAGRKCQAFTADSAAVNITDSPMLIGTLTALTESTVPCSLTTTAIVITSGRFPGDDRSSMISICDDIAAGGVTSRSSALYVGSVTGAATDAGLVMPGPATRAVPTLAPAAGDVVGSDRAIAGDGVAAGGAFNGLTAVATVGGATRAGAGAGGRGGTAVFFGAATGLAAAAKRFAGGRGQIHQAPPATTADNKSAMAVNPVFARGRSGV